MKVKYNKCDILVPARVVIPCRNTIAYFPNKDGLYDENHVAGKLVLAFVRHEKKEEYLAIPRILFADFTENKNFMASGMFVYSDEDWFPFTSPVPLMFRKDEKTYELRIQPKRQYNFEIE